MKIARAAEMREREARAFAQGLSSAILMETAGGAVARAAQAMLGGAAGRVLVLVGPGQNGGDGLVAARHLLARGHALSVWLLADPQRLRGDALDQYRRLRQSPRVRWHKVDEPPGGPFDLAIDAIFGTSIRGALRDGAAAAVRYLDERAMPVLAVDLPSGVLPDSGEIAGVAVRAERTVALGALKPGHVFSPGREYCGEVELEPLGLLPGWIDDLPLERLDGPGPGGGQSAGDPKQAYGRVLIVGGSGQYPGAPWLAARGAARGGAGLVIVASVPDALHGASALPEAVIRPLAADGGDLIDPTDLTAARWHDVQAVAIGPGLGDPGQSLGRWREAILAVRRPLVLDADGLRPFAGRPELLRGRGAPTVLTPHLGEARRLAGMAIGDFPAARLEAAQVLAQRAGAVIVLKGRPTFVAAPWGRVAVVDEGGPELATAGSGDVLTGLIAAQLAQGIPARRAAERGALAHARAGARMRLAGSRGLLAHEIAEMLPAALEES